MVARRDEALHEADVAAVSGGQNAQMVALASLGRGDGVAGLERVVLRVEREDGHPHATQLAGEPRVAVVVRPVMVAKELRGEARVELADGAAGKDLLQVPQRRLVKVVLDLKGSSTC